MRKSRQGRLNARRDRSEWQAGYGAFTIGIFQIPGTVNYVRNQEKHHAKSRFAEEWKIFMRRHGLSKED
jgi:putative transposase